MRWMAVGMVGMLGACGPLVGTGESQDGPESSGDDATTSGSTTVASTTVGTTASTSTSTSTTTSTTSTSTTATTNDTSPPPPDGSICQAACEIASDCCFAYVGDQDCMGMLGTYPWNFSCDAGVCRSNGCTSDEDCTFGGVVVGWVCIPGEEPRACQPVCMQDSDCVDAGVSDWVCGDDGYCVLPSCDTDQDCEAGLRCNPITSQCVYGCTDDSTCIGYGICDRETGQCVCTDESECPRGWTCAPF